MASGLPQRPPFDALTPLEQALFDRLRGMIELPARGLVVDGGALGNAAVSATFLRWFLLEAIPASGLPIGRFELRRGSISGMLNLGGSESALLLRFVRCKFGDGINLTDASIRSLELISGEVSEIWADRLSTTGSVHVRAPIPDEAWLLPEPDGTPITVHQMIRLSGADIGGNLDLRGCRLGTQQEEPADTATLLADGLHVGGGLLLSNGARVKGELRLNGARIDRNLDLAGAQLSNPCGYTLSLAGAKIKGSVILNEVDASEEDAVPEPFISIGSVRLDGAKIGGSLDCTGGLFVAEVFAGPAPPAGTQPEEDLYAIEANGLEVGAEVFFNGRFCALGIVSLIGARIEGDFICEGGCFHFPGEDAVVADGLVVAGTTFLGSDDESKRPTRTNGVLRFALAEFRQGLEIIGAVFATAHSCQSWQPHSNADYEAFVPAGRGACGVYGPSCEVRGTFYWEKICKFESGSATNNVFVLHLFDATAESVEDDEPSWKALDRFNVTGCNYGSLSDLTGDISWRVKELDREYAVLNLVGEKALPAKPRVKLPGPSFALRLRVFKRAMRRRFGYADADDAIAEAVKHFKPQPYIQLAKIVRAAGYEEAAALVAVRLEQNKTLYSDFGVLRILGRAMLEAFIKYGFAPFRPIRILFAWMIFSAVIFHAAYAGHFIVPSKDNLDDLDSGKFCNGERGSKLPRISFNAVVFAVDTLVPLVDLNQKKNWAVEPSVAQTCSARSAVAMTWLDVCGEAMAAALGSASGLLFIFNAFFGWVMTSMTAAGITGLVRNGKDDS